MRKRANASPFLPALPRLARYSHGLVNLNKNEDGDAFLVRRSEAVDSHGVFPLIMIKHERERSIEKKKLPR